MSKKSRTKTEEAGVISTVRAPLKVIKKIENVAKLQNRSKSNMVSVILQEWADKETDL